MNKLKNVVCVLIAISFAIISGCGNNKQPEESTDCDMTIYESTSSSFDAIRNPHSVNASFDWI